MVWECACGEGHISKVLESHGYNVVSTDLVYRGYGRLNPCDFLLENRLHEDVAKHTAMYDALKIVSDMVTELEWLSNWKD